MGAVQTQMDIIERLMRERDQLRVALRVVVRHWDEFGPEHGMDEVIDSVRQLVQPTSTE